MDDKVCSVRSIEVLRSVTTRHHQRMQAGAPISRSWNWSNKIDSMNRYSAYTLNQDPGAPLGHPTSQQHPHRKMASADAPEGRQTAADYTDVDRGIPEHVGPEKQIHSATGYNLYIGINGEVRGTREPFNEQAILEFYSRSAGEVQMKGKISQLYLGMNESGKIYAEPDGNSENTWFKETLQVDGGWSRYMWLGNNKNWYLAIKKSGSMKKGPKTKYSQRSVKFVPRPAR